MWRIWCGSFWHHPGPILDPEGLAYVCMCVCVFLLPPPPPPPLYIQWYYELLFAKKNVMLHLVKYLKDRE